MRARLVVILVAGLLGASIGAAVVSQALSPDPPATGARDPALRTIQQALDAEVDGGVRAGFVAGFVTRDGEARLVAAGMANRETGAPMTIETRFRIASMTKPIITAAIMQLVDRGVLTLEDPVARYIPAYAEARVALTEEPDAGGRFETRPPTRAVTIHDLLTHTAGIGYVFDRASTLDRVYVEANLLTTQGTLAERIDRIARLPLYDDPGKEWRYSYSIDIAARIIEVATGEPIEAYLKEHLLDPLGMADTEFFLDHTDFDRVATVYEFDADGKLAAAGDIDLAGDINKDGFGVASGGAGLVSSAPDYLRFCLMMLRGGDAEGGRVLSKESVQRMMADNLAPGANARLWERDSASFGLGGTVVIDATRATGAAVNGEWGWTGHFDTWFVVNPEDGVAAVVLSQTNPGPTMPMSRARARVKSVAYEAAIRR